MFWSRSSFSNWRDRRSSRLAIAASRWSAASGDSQDASAAATMLDFERSEEHTSELQSLMRISYAVFCLKKKKKKKGQITINRNHAHAINETTELKHIKIHTVNTVQPRRVLISHRSRCKMRRQRSNQNKP